MQSLVDRLHARRTAHACRRDGLRLAGQRPEHRPRGPQPAGSRSKRDSTASGSLLIALVAWTLGALLDRTPASPRQAGSPVPSRAHRSLSSAPSRSCARSAHRARRLHPCPRIALTRLVADAVLRHGLVPAADVEGLHDLRAQRTHGRHSARRGSIMYNSDLILHGAMWLFGRIRWLAPMLKAGDRVSPAAAASAPASRWPCSRSSCSRSSRCPPSSPP